jgi:hypothetical protein
MKIESSFSSAKSLDVAVRETRSALAHVSPVCVVYFASPAYDPESMARAMKEAFPAARTLGCTTSGEIGRGRMLKQSLVALAMGEDVLEKVDIQVVERLKDRTAVEEAFLGFEKEFGQPMRDVDFQRHVGLVLVDGLSGAEERLMQKVGDLTDVRFVGGSAGDDLKFAATHVFADGRALRDAAVLALLRPRVKFDILKTQSFRATEKRLVATRTLEAAREVVEFNGKPAAEAYAEAVGVEAKEAANHFMHNPVGLMVDGEPYVRSPQRLKGSSMVFYCNVLQGMELRLLEGKDIVADTRAALEQKKKEMGGMTGIINFHCILRTLELEKNGQAEAYGALFSDVPSVGFSTYGEEYVGHINQTSTMLLLGKA